MSPPCLQHMGPGPEMFAGSPSAAVRSRCLMTLGPRPAPPGDREEGVDSVSRAPQPQEEEGLVSPGEPAALSASPGLRPFRGRSWDRNSSRVRRGRSCRVLPAAPPPLELSGGDDPPTRAAPAREESWLPIPHCAPLGPGGRAGNGARLGQNEKQLREEGAECLGGRVQLTKQWLLESAAAAAVPRQAPIRATPAWVKAAVLIQPQMLAFGEWWSGWSQGPSCPGASPTLCPVACRDNWECVLSTCGAQY